MNNAWAISSVVIRELCRRKDIYVLFILTAVVTVTLGSANFFNDNRIVRYLKEICLLLIWISGMIIAIGTAARQIPSERENRTIFPLLAKPVTRWEFLFGKYLGCWLACSVAIAVFYVFFAILTGIRENAWPLGHYLQAVWLHSMFLAVVVAFVVLGSIVFAAPSSNGTISFLLIVGELFLGRHLNTLASRMVEPGQSITYALYYAIPHLEFYDTRDLITHEYPLIPWMIVIEASIYAAVYVGIFLLAAWLAFRRKAL
jgi:ABC-type transport system involved in multi-copper enzyme maturation permease subunit